MPLANFSKPSKKLNLNLALIGLCALITLNMVCIAAIAVISCGNSRGMAAKLLKVEGTL